MKTLIVLLLSFISYTPLFADDVSLAGGYDNKEYSSGDVIHFLFRLRLQTQFDEISLKSTRGYALYSVTPYDFGDADSPFQIKIVNSYQFHPDGVELTLEWVVPNKFKGSYDSNTYFLQIQAHNPSSEPYSVNVKTRTFVIHNTPRGIAPKDKQENIPIPVGLSWMPVLGATKYHLEVSTDPIPMAFGVTQVADFVIDDTVTESTHILTNLQSNYVYYWRVKAAIGDKWLPPSESQSFKTGSSTDVKENIDKGEPLIHINGKSIHLSNWYPDSYAVIYTVTGQEILTIYSKSSNLSNLPTGVYIVGVFNENKLQFQKLIYLE